MENRGKVQISERDGKLFVGDETGGYQQGVTRTLWLVASDLSLSHNIDRHNVGDDEPLRRTYWLQGRASLDGDRIGVIGEPESVTSSVDLTLHAWPEGKPAGRRSEWKASIGFLAHDWEAGDEDTWYAELWLPKAVLDEIISFYRNQRLTYMQLGVESDLWVTETARFKPLGRRIDWFLRPDKNGDTGFPESANAEIIMLKWGESKQQLDPPPGSKTERRAQMDDEMEREALNANAEAEREAACDIAREKDDNNRFWALQRINAINDLVASVYVLVAVVFLSAVCISAVIWFG